MDQTLDHTKQVQLLNEKAAGTRGLPFVSVIMPVRNESEFIESSLSSVIRQDYPHDRLEIWVADGASTDGTVAIVERIASEVDIPVKVLPNPKKVAPSGLNLAIANSRGEIIIRVDGHCEIEPDYITECVKYLVEGRANGVGGPIETIGEGKVAEAIAMAMSSGFGVGGSAFRTVKDREMYTDTVAFPAYTREIIELAGPFNEELVRNQDDEYNYRIRKLGGRILLSPKIRSRYYSRSTFRSLWRQYYQYGYWKVRVLQLHPAQTSVRQFVPFGFVLTVASLSVLSAVSSLALAPLGAVAAAYLTANLLATFVAARDRINRVPYVAFSFLILHVSYGLGSISGLIAFRNRWGESSHKPPPGPDQRNEHISSDTPTKATKAVG
jgi:glycosyltransferase involved in cell wall biosynthesis